MNNSVVPRYYPYRFDTGRLPVHCDSRIVVARAVTAGAAPVFYRLSAHVEARRMIAGVLAIVIPILRSIGYRRCSVRRLVVQPRHLVSVLPAQKVDEAIHRA